MRKYVTEFIGTLGLVFTIGAVAWTGAALGPVAIGVVLMVMVYAGGHISGGHYNPAVTLGVYLRGKLPWPDVWPYWIAQAAGALVGGGLAAVATHAPPVHRLYIPPNFILAALVAEFVFTLALVYVMLSVATSKDHPGNSFYGLAIGFTVLAGAIAVGSISGGAFNPAVAVAATVYGLFSWANIWIYLLAQPLGGVAAAIVFRYLNPADVAGGPVPKPSKTTVG